MTYEEAIRHWWVLILRGVAAIVFGFVALVWPDITLTFLIALFAAYALVDGTAAVVAGFSRDRSEDRWPMIGIGVLGLIVGVVTILVPGLTALTLLYIIAFWAIMTGIAQLWSAIRFRRAIENEWLLGFSGLFSVLFGIVVAIFPGAGAVSIVWIIGLYAMTFGFASVILGLRLRSWGQHGQRPAIAH